jgi:hypothetical protein
MACLTNPISQPSSDISPIWIPPISNEVSSSQKNLYDVTDSSWVFARFHSRAFRFYSTVGTSRYYMSSQIFPHFIALVLMHLVLVGYVCSTNFYLRFYPSSTRVRDLSQFLLYIFLISPAELA